MKKNIKEKIIQNNCGTKLSQNECQRRLFEMLFEFDKFCRENTLTYYLAFGTLIGAVRHHNFIPWDDDVDLIMPRQDYERLISMNKINDDLDIVSWKNPNGYYHPYAYCNITDKRTIMVENFAEKPTGKGLFLDVFPLDGVPDERQIKSHLKKIYIWRSMLNCRNNVYNIKSLNGFVHFVTKLLSKLFPERFLLKKIDTLLNKYEYGKTKYCASLLTLSYPMCVLETASFNESINTDFNGISLKIPKEYHLILTKIYGDYMTLPPESERIGSHGLDIYWRK